ncbi:MAG: Ig-like domain-containing protein [bacterium]
MEVNFAKTISLRRLKRRLKSATTSLTGYLQENEMKCKKFKILLLTIIVLLLKATVGFSALDIDVISPDGGEVWSGGTYKEIIWKISDGTPTYTIELKYSTDGGNSFPYDIGTTTQTAIGTGTYNWLVPTSDLTNVKIMVMATDSATPTPNIGTTTSQGTFTIDATPPNVLLNLYIPDPTDDNTPTYTGTVTDSTTKVVDIEYKVDSGGWTDVDSFIPAATAAFTFTTSSLSDGPHTITVRAKDEAGNWGTSTPDTLVVDTTGPISQVNAITPYWHNIGTFTLYYGASDNLGLGSITLWYRYRVSLTTPWTDWSSFTTRYISGTSAIGNFSFTHPEQEGYYDFYTIADDSAGNKELVPPTKDAEAGYDKTPPTIPSNTLLRPNGGELFMGNSIQEIRWNNEIIGDTLSGLGTYSINLKYSTDGGMSYPETITMVSLPKGNGIGTYCWTVPMIECDNVKVAIIVTDNAGNPGTDTSNGTFVISSIAPTLKIDVPNGGENWRGGTNQIIKWSTTGSGINHLKIWYSTNGGGTYTQINGTLSNIGTYSWTCPTIDSNQVKIKITIYDIEDKELSTDESDNNFIIDSTSPTIENLRPSNEIVNDLPVISAWLRDIGAIANSGIGSITVWIDNSETNIRMINFDSNKSQKTFEGNNLTATLKNPLSAGLHEVKVWVCDKAGNSAATASTTFTVSNEPGIIDLINYPNPFSTDEKTIIKYTLGRDSRVTINIYDISLEWMISLIEDADRTTGTHKENWYGQNAIGEKLPNGVYICELIVKEKNAGTEHKKYHKIAIYTSK